MIIGQINQSGSPILRITAYGNKGEITIDGILDTGFERSKGVLILSITPFSGERSLYICIVEVDKRR